MRSLGTISLLLFVTLASAALAASQQDWDDCKQDKDHDRRIAGCTRVLQDQAESAGNRAIAHRNRGIAYNGLGARDRARADFDEAIKLDPKFAAAYVSRGATHSREDFAKAVADYDEAIKLDPKSTDAYESRGVRYFNNKDYDRAIADFNEASKIDPQRALPYQLRGYAHYTKKDYDRSIADYNEAIRLEPLATRYGLRAMTYRAKKDYDRAVADYSETIKLDPKSSFRYTNRASAYAERKDYDRAIADYSEAIKLAPKDAGAIANRGDMHRAKKDYDRAIADYSEAIKLDPKLAFAYNGRGVAYDFKNNYDRAIADYSEAVKLAPDVPVYRENLASVQRAKRDAAAAKQPRGQQHYLLNLTPVRFDVIDNGRTVCSLAPEQDCWWPAPAGQHTIELRRQDGKSVRMSLTTSGSSGVLHQVVCPTDFGTSERSSAPACN